MEASARLGMPEPPLFSKVGLPSAIPLAHCFRPQLSDAEDQDIFSWGSSRWPVYRSARALICLSHPPQSPEFVCSWC